MDQRSSASLLLVAAFGRDSHRKAALWVFPNEEALQLRRSKDEASIEILRDVFSQRSKFRKAALFEGDNGRNGFLGGKILDYQASSRRQDVAEFFIGAFLGCKLSMTSEVGSTILAETIKDVHGHLTDQAQREQLHAAIMAVRQAPRARVSMREFATRYLDGTLRSEFLNRIDTPEMATAVFEFSRVDFDAVLQFRAFQLRNGAFVYAPLSEIGRGIHVEDGKLTCAGEIETEKLRTRHA